MRKKLFLDDIRKPSDAYDYTKDVWYLLWNWDVVRNYNEFVEYIETNGLPDIISFDHDLALEHYTPEEYWSDYEKNKAFQESRVYKEKNGYHCAQWLVEYCLDNNLQIPYSVCHSMNPVGKDNILGLLDSFNNRTI